MNFTISAISPTISPTVSQLRFAARRPGGALRLSFDQLLGRGAAAAGGGLHRLHGVSHRWGRVFLKGGR